MKRNKSSRFVIFLFCAITGLTGCNEKPQEKQKNEQIMEGYALREVIKSFNPEKPLIGQSWSADSAVLNPEGAKKAFDEFLIKGGQIAIPGQVTFSEVKEADGYFYARISNVEFPWFLVVKKSDRTVFIGGMSP